MGLAIMHSSLSPWALSLGFFCGFMTLVSMSKALTLRRTLDVTPDVIATLGLDGTFMSVNRFCLPLLGYEPKELVGQPFQTFVLDEDRGCAAQVIAALRTSDSVTAFQCRFVRPNGKAVWMEWRFLPAVSEGKAYCAGSDITERKALEQQLAHMAFHDPLTQLANRALFMERLKHELLVEARHHPTCAVLFLDLDNFKVINDSLGHDAGDQLLQQVAFRLKACLRDEDTVARYGGDEFAILIRNVTDENEAGSVALRIREAFKTSFLTRGKELLVGVSIGVALSAQEELDPDALLSRADVAMYQSKQDGLAFATWNSGMDALPWNIRNCGQYGKGDIS
jgi:diguanylate cyclase (GGDEF)-like protein/PAS domain S-box-containing protein